MSPTYNRSCTVTDVSNGLTRLMNQTEWVVIPCGGKKADVTCAAVDLYVGSFFQQVLDSARSLVDDDHILILSARHGLITLDTALAPYDLKMGQAGSVSVETIVEQAIDLGIGEDDTVMTMLPKQYETRLNEAMWSVGPIPFDVFEANAGMGEMKQIAKKIRDQVAA